MKHILDFPELRQTYDYDCGASSVQSILEYYGISMREDLILKELHTDKELGTNWKQIVKYFEKKELEVKHGKFTIDDLISFLNEGIPVLIVLQAYRDNETIDWESDVEDGHYVVAIGYAKTNKWIIFEDPANFNRTYIPFDELENRWHDIDPATNKRLEHFGIAVYGKTPKFHNDYMVKMP